MSVFDIFIKLIIALLLSGFIGFERELTGRHAGLRTHILVGLGACLIMLTSVHVFDIYKNTITGLDPARIAAGVVTGVGFLGAGAIMRGGDGVKGLTTAASLWIVAAIGMAVGLGFFSAAVLTAIFVLIVLVILRRIEHVVHKTRKK